MGLSGVPYAKTIKKRCLYSNYRLIHSAITNGLDYYKSTNYALYNIQMTHLNKFISVFRFLPATLRFALCFGRNEDLFCQEALRLSFRRRYMPERHCRLRNPEALDELKL